MISKEQAILKAWDKVCALSLPCSPEAIYVELHDGEELASYLTVPQQVNSQWCMAFRFVDVTEPFDQILVTVDQVNGRVKVLPNL